MAVFQTKDFTANKSDKVRLAVGRRLGHPGVPATNAEVDAEMTQHCRDLVELDEAANWVATKPAVDQL